MTTRDPAGRLLRLLSLLQSRTDWPGPELADRLGVSTRTIRSDIERLRDLGYPVSAVSGTAGGYRLGPGARLPPLLLDDEEAVAVAIGLRTAAAQAVDGIEETSLRALAKLELVLPARLRPRVAALAASTVPMPGNHPAVDVGVLATLAAACRDRRRVRFDYRDHDGNATVRDAEPYRLVPTGRRWYLVAWDVDRDDWRTFRIDRLTPRTPLGPVFPGRWLPPEDAIDVVTRGVASTLGPCRTVATVHAPASAVSERVPPVARVEHLDDERCLLHIGAATPLTLAVYLAALGLPFTVDGPAALLEALRQVSRHCADAVSGAVRRRPARPAHLRDHRKDRERDGGKERRREREEERGTCPPGTT
ncbi:DNA-binding transcriptional regulator [Streptosporangium pseudovulgare]|uniref:DNA-binding transcriptional regulator n=1 Tax=Streptosporangium pseudovulgare TaxID=35765 RepID=A0ABQ2RBC9_9ACTN|nr:YafY family protein [Streptosporangium pseudovulgare]GGQ19709.1 DNA-binding transcriptional regulator [Streptosporangium pseudovulgare]